MKNFIPDGTLDIVVLGPMDQSRPKADANCIKLAKAINAVLKRAEFKRLLKDANFLNATAVAPEDFGRNQILNGVIHYLENADLVVIDLTARDGTTQPTPNVMYELGLVHALGLPYILVRKDAEAGGLPFYLNQTHVTSLDYDDEAVLKTWAAKELRTFLDPSDKRDFSENDVSDYFYGAPLIDISAAAGVAVGYYDNFVFRLIGEPEGYLAKQDMAFDTFVCAVPDFLPNTKDQDGETLAKLFESANIPLTSKSLPPLTGSTDRPLGVKFVGNIIIDVPTTLYPLRRSPRLVKQRKQATRAGAKVEERKMQARLIQQFLRMLRFLIDQDHAENKVRASAIHIVSLSDVVQKVKDLQKGTPGS